MLTGDGLTRIATVVKLGILAHVLSPHDYGIFGVAALLTQWLSYFTQTGLDVALIQRRGGIDSYLNAYWTSQVVRGIGLAVLLFIGAPAGSAFFNAPEAVPIVRVIAIGAAVYGLRNPGVVYLRKELSFRKDALWRFAGTLVGLLVAVPLAFALRNVWALAISVVASDLAEVVASYFVHPYRPRISLQWRTLGELTSYSKWIVVSNVLTFLQQNMDSIVVGKLLGASTLGFYQVASQMAVMPLAQAGTQMRAVLFPTFSKIADRSTLRQGFLFSFRALAALIIPAGCFLAVFAAPIVHTLLGSKWSAASAVVPVLVVAGILKGFAALSTAMLLADGRPRVTVYGSLIEIGAFACLAYPLLHAGGLMGAAEVIVLSSLLVTIYQFSVIHSSLQFYLLDMVRHGKTAFIATLPFLAVLPLVTGPLSWRIALLAAAALSICFAVLLNAVRSDYLGNSNVFPIVPKDVAAHEEVVST